MPQPLSRRISGLTGATLAAPNLPWAANEVPTSLDHILLGSNDLDKGIALVEEKTGVRGHCGVHPGRGTRNALLSLGEKHYLKLSRLIPPSRMQPNSKPCTQETQRARLVGWAAHPGDSMSSQETGAMPAWAFEGPRPGSRKRPDGAP